mmetsp:Transcript_8134/g.15089  ORF Transcript_8134/g.15089 Transcript_8134/m.15089 type:complete len:364 (+) Transcript_8134:40-1131(+)
MLRRCSRLASAPKPFGFSGRKPRLNVSNCSPRAEPSGRRQLHVHRVALVCDPDNPVLACQPTLPNVEFVLGNSEADFPADIRQELKAFIYVIPGSLDTLKAVWQASDGAEWVHSFYTGIDALKPFTSTSLRDGQILTNARGAYSESLAEWSLTSCLYFNKQIQRVQANKGKKHWDKFVMGSLYGKTIGFVGFGHIAQTTAKLARAFGMNVVALRNNPDLLSPLADEVYGFEKRFEMLGKCDFVVCSLPGTEQTDKFMGQDEFEAMQPSAVFISIGRGIAVDEDALNRALDSKSIAGAALDVFRTEPLPVTSALWDRENVLLTAHNADYTEDYFRRGWEVWMENFEAYTNKQPLVTPVDYVAGY